VYERALDVDHRNIGLWLKYTEMEMRNKQVNHARNLWDRAVTILPRANQFWYKYTYMEEMLNHIAGQGLFSSYAGTVINVRQEKPLRKIGVICSFFRMASSFNAVLVTFGLITNFYSSSMKNNRMVVYFIILKVKQTVRYL
jgi:hypothetical protein